MVSDHGSMLLFENVACWRPIPNIPKIPRSDPDKSNRKQKGHRTTVPPGQVPRPATKTKTSGLAKKVGKVGEETLDLTGKYENSRGRHAAKLLQDAPALGDADREHDVPGASPGTDGSRAGAPELRVFGVRPRHRRSHFACRIGRGDRSVRIDRERERGRRMVYLVGKQKD